MKTKFSMKTKFTMPTPEMCKAKGIKLEGLYSRTQMWFMGISSALSWVSPIHTEIVFPNKNTIVFETNSATVMNNVKDRLEAYGITSESV